MSCGGSDPCAKTGSREGVRNPIVKFLVYYDPSFLCFGTLLCIYLLEFKSQE